MALGSEEQRLYQQQQQQSQPQSTLRHIAPLPYSKPTTAPTLMTTTEGYGTVEGVCGPSVVRRNARERNRVKQVNNGFSNLRQHIPVAVIADLSNGRRGIGPGANKKLSKVNTLRMAVEYIRRLQRLIDENDGNQKKSTKSSHSSQMQHQFHHNQLHQQQQHQQQLEHQQFLAFQQQLQLGSPSGSISSLASSSSCSSSDAQAFYGQQHQHHHHHHQQQQQPSPSYTSFKLENSYDDCQNNMSSCSSGAEEDDILDYISLWQDDM